MHVQCVFVLDKTKSSTARALLLVVLPTNDGVEFICPSILPLPKSKLCKKSMKFSGQEFDLMKALLRL